MRGRNPHTQAILALRGKILNVERARLDRALGNREVQAMIQAFGTGIGEDFDIAKLDPAPKCIRVRPIKTMELDVALPADRICLQSAGSGGNLVAVPGATTASGDSLCANTEWNVAAKVEDARTGAAVQLNQGVAVRVEKANAANFCK